MAGAIAFNVLVAFVPLILAIIGIASAVMQQQNKDVAGMLLGYVVDALPDAGSDFRQKIHGLLQDITRNSAGILSIGTVVFIWLATRLIGTLRAALREVFDIERDRGIIAGKLFDLKMVVAAGSLFAINVAITVLVEYVYGYGKGIINFDLRGTAVHYLEFLSAQLVAFAFIWAMFLMIYRYLPARRTSWRTSVIAATFTALIFEIMKQLFSLYAGANDYGSVYGSLAFLLVLVLWIYYTAVVFILGGEVAQVAAMQRIRQRQRERLQ